MAHSQQMGPPSMEPIVVTGMSSLTAEAETPVRLSKLIRRESSPATWVSDVFGQGGEAVPACEVLDFWMSDTVRHATRQLDRSAQLAVAAAENAWQDSLPSLHSWDPSRVAVVAGTSRGPIHRWEEALCGVEHRRRRPSLGLSTPIANLSGVIAHALGFSGPNQTVSATCSSGAHAIITGAQQLLLGAADIALVGAAEAPLHPAIIAQLQASGILGHAESPEKVCRPFDRQRNGLLLGEGAAFLVLEPLSRSRARESPYCGTLSGWACGLDRAGRTTNQEDGTALAKVLDAALQSAGLRRDEIDYINLHGTATRSNDRVEANALKQVYRDASFIPACSATKPFTGHCLGASSAIEAVIALIALNEEFLPPTLNHEDPDDIAEGMELVPLQGRSIPVDHVMTNALGFWGNQSSLIFSRLYPRPR